MQHNDALPFDAELDLPINAVLTDNGREFCGAERHPCELYLALNDIEPRKTRVGSPKTNGPPAPPEAGSFGLGSGLNYNQNVSGNRERSAAD